jgi:hypothetical protein
MGVSSATTSGNSGTGRKASIVDQLAECRKNNTLLELKNLSSDMHPVLQYGDILSVKACSADDLNEGDFFYYQSGSSVKLRRFLKRKYQHHEMQILGKAETLNAPDDPIRPVLVVGKVISVKRNGKSVNPKDPGLLRKILMGLGLLSLSS